MRSCIIFVAILSNSGGTSAGMFQHAYDAALVNDATYQAARAELASSQQALPMARASMLPNVSFFASDAKVEGSRTSTNFVGQPVSSPLDYRAPVQSVNIRAPIFNRENSQKAKLAQAQVEFSEALFATRKGDLVDRLANAYFQRLTSENAMLVAHSQVDAAKSQSDLARKRFQLGEGTKPEVGEADAALDVASAALLEAQSQVKVSRLIFRQITGTDPDSIAAAANDFSAPIGFFDIPTTPNSLEYLLAKANVESPSIVARRQAVAVAQAAVARNSAGHYPRLDFVASASSSRNESLSTLNQSSSQRSFGLQFNLPIYSGGYVSAAVTQALADQDKAEAELAAEQQLVARELSKLYFGVENGAVKIHAYRKAFESSSLALESARKGITTGFTTQTDVAVGRRKQAQALNDLSQSIYTYLITRMRLLARAGAKPEQVVADIDVLLK